MENEIIKADCIEEMKKIPDGSIDLILTDPPYMISSSVKIRRQRNPMKFGKVYKYQGKDISFEFGCVLPNEIIYTSQGIKEIKDIATEDLVMGKDGNFYRVKKILKYKYNGDVVGLKPKFNQRPTFFTPNHKIPIGRRDEFFKGIFEKEAQEIKLGDFVVMPKNKTIIDKDDLRLSYQEKRHQKNNIPDKIFVEKDFMRLLGYFFAEGSRCKSYIKFSFSSEETIFIEDCCSLIEKYFHKKPKIYSKGSGIKGVDIVLHSRKVADLFEKEFYKEKSKYVPSWIWFLPLPKQEEFIKGWWRGDSWEGDLTMELSTKKREDAYANKWILMRLGYYPTLTYKDLFRHGKNYRQYQIWMAGREGKISFKHNKTFKRIKNRNLIYEDEYAFYLPIKKIVKERYNGFVYDLEVEKNSHYTLSGFVVHNSWDIFPSLEAYLDFSKKWFIEAIRVLRKAGSIVSFWDKHKLTYMVNWANELNVKNRQCLWWVKTNPVPQARKVGFMSAVECMWWGTKFSTSRKDGYVFHYELGQHPDYFKHSIVGHTTKIDGERAHPTQKPIKLGEWIISYLSNKGDIVLDPFCGSGTFCIAAKRLGRRYIGIDISEEYCEGARQRLRQTEEPLF